MEECPICFESLSDVPLCWYQWEGSQEWALSNYCWICTEAILDNEFDQYIDTIHSNRCKKTLREMIERGPPIWLEHEGFPTPNGERLTKLKHSDGTEVPAIYSKAVIGEKRATLWDQLRKDVETRMKTLPDD